MMYTPMMHMMGYWGNGGLSTGTMGGFYGIVGFIITLLFWILIIGGIVVLIRWFTRNSKNGFGGKTALEILKERYAKGEIDKEEFEKVKKDLV